jgi:hypothetical protein
VSRAQDTQLLPEIAQHFKSSSNIRLLLQAKDDREGGDPEQFRTECCVLSKNLLKLKSVTVSDLNGVKKQPVLFDGHYEHENNTGKHPNRQNNSWGSRFLHIFHAKEPVRFDDLLLRGQFLFVQTGTPGEDLLKDLFCTKNLAVIPFGDDISPSPAAWNVLD